jgi:hypothetical protein
MKAHAQRPDIVFRRKEWVHLNRQGLQFSRLPAAEVCASAVVMLDKQYSEVVWRVLATHSIRQFPLHFPSRASPCAITFQLDSTSFGNTNSYLITALLCLQPFLLCSYFLLTGLHSLNDSIATVVSLFALNPRSTLLCMSWVGLVSLPQTEEQISDLYIQVCADIQFTQCYTSSASSSLQNSHHRLFLLSPWSLKMSLSSWNKHSAPLWGFLNTDTAHSVWSPARVIGPSQKSLHANTQHSQETRRWPRRDSNS